MKTSEKIQAVAVKGYYITMLGGLFLLTVYALVELIK